MPENTNACGLPLNEARKHVTKTPRCEPGAVQLNTRSKFSATVFYTTRRSMSVESILEHLSPAVLPHLSIVREQSTRIRDLSGFRKGHQIPAEHNDRTASFVCRLAGTDINDELETRFAEIRSAFRLKRTELTVSDSDNGLGMIQTPWFDFQVIATQCVNDPAMVIWRRVLCAFRHPEKLAAAETTAVFGNSFDRVEFLPVHPIDITSVIDHIEDLDQEPISLEYDRHCTFCVIHIRGQQALMRVTPGCVSFISTTPTSPGRLLTAFGQLQSQMAQGGVDLLPSHC